VNIALFAFSVDARENKLAKMELHETQHHYNSKKPQTIQLKYVTRSKQQKRQNK